MPVIDTRPGKVSGLRVHGDLEKQPKEAATRDAPKSLSPVYGLVVCLLFVVLGCTVALAYNPQSWVIVLGTFCLNGVAFLVTSSTIRPILWSPVFVFACFMTVMGMVGYTLGEKLRESATGIASIDFWIDGEVQVRTAVLFFLASTCVLLAGSAVLRGAKQSSAMLRGSVSLALIARTNYKSEVATALVLGAATVTLFLIIANSGLPYILSRPERFGDRGPLDTVLAPLSMALVAALGLVIKTGSVPAKICAGTYACLLELFFASQASRAMGLVPLLLVLGFYVGSGKPSKTAIMTSMAMGAILATLALHFRGQSEHGLLPYWDSMETYNFNTSVILALLNNLIIGFTIVGGTAFVAAPISMEAFSVSVNPLPGNMVGWYEVAPSLRINRYVPYGAVGEIGNRGWAWSAVSFAVLGIVLGSVQRYTMKAVARGLTFAPILIVGVTCLMAVQSCQYNLRSEMRWVYALTATAIGLRLLSSRMREVSNGEAQSEAVASVPADG